MRRCKHDMVSWEDYYSAHFRMCRLCDLVEVEVANGNKGTRWIPVDKIMQHDASAMWKALKQT